MKHSTRNLVLATVAAALPYSSAHAQTAKVDGDDIVVTATKQGQTRLQDTALAITAVGTELLDRSAAKDIRDIQSFSPSLTITQNGNAAAPYIRGIGSNNTFPGSDPSTTLYVDGVYIARPTGFFIAFLDLDRVEVLRGPQGTLYGRNAVGGAINLISRKPGETLEGKAQFTVGNFDLLRGEAYVSGPLSDSLGFGISARRSKRAGYFKNIFVPNDDADDENDTSMRAQLRGTPSTNLEVLLRGDYYNSHSNFGTGTKIKAPISYDPIANSIINQPRTLSFNTPISSTVRSWGVSGEVNYDLSASGKLMSLTAYRESRAYSLIDSDFSTASVRTTNQQYNQHQFSQELNVSGELGQLKYVAGVYYFDERILSSLTVTNFGASRVDIAPIVNTASFAGYAQGTFAVTPKLSLTAGIRYTHERKSFDQSFAITSLVTGTFLPGYPVSYPSRGIYKAWTPKFGIEYRPAEHVMLYASATRGFKSGGFSFTSANKIQGFAPESLWSYEAGLKSDLFARRLRFNLTGFYYDYKNLQVQSFLVPGVIDITNAATATVKGFEAETRLRVIDGIQVGGALTYVDATYKSYPKAIGPGNVVYDASGNRLNASPRWAYNLFLELESKLGNGGRLFGRADFNWRGLQYYTQQNVAIESQPAYGLLNGNLGYTSPGERFEVSVFVRNLADKVYSTSTATLGGATVGVLGAPRSYGIQLSARY